jgi:hypothetical protein
MKAVEFHTKLHSQETIEIPALYQGLIATEQDVRVIVLIDEKQDSGTAWQDTVTKQFFKGYSEEDSEYDAL